LTLPAVGETEEIVAVLDQLQNTKERGVDAYTRLSGLMLKISGFQPSAPIAMVEMLEKSIEISEAAVDAGEATVTEAKNDWNIS
jgi:predicted transcriptional regulator